MNVTFINNDLKETLILETHKIETLTNHTQDEVKITTPEEGLTKLETETDTLTEKLVVVVVVVVQCVCGVSKTESENRNIIKKLNEK